MPDSMEGSHPFMVAVARNLFAERSSNKPLKVLDCGMGTGLIAKKICEAIEPRALAQRNKPKSLTFTGLEIFAPYVVNPTLRGRLGRTYYWLYESLVLGKEADFAQWLRRCETGRFDVIVFGDSLEHLDPAWAEHALAHALRVTQQAVIVNVPTCFMPQDALYGNLWETHRLYWGIDVWRSFGSEYVGGDQYVGCFVWRKDRWESNAEFRPCFIREQSQGPRYDKHGRRCY